MALKQITVWGYVCERCEHEWIPKNKDDKPRVCPKCKSPYWDKPRRNKAGKKKSSKKKAAKKDDSKQ